MNKIAKFEKVSYKQFKKDYIDCFNEESNEKIKEIYDNIKLPKRATKGSAGYDFYSPITFTLKPCETIKIPTGIRVKIEDGWFLANFPRSGLGFKYRLQLNNTVGIIDADYYNALNEGHIMSKLTNDSKENKEVLITAGSGFTQGIFLPFGITVDDESDEIRTGGFGSTSK
jgi:dUTP pyrophosphatase